MKNRSDRVVTIIAALDEERSIGQVLRRIPRDWVDDVVVVDNGSTDATARIAAEHGARVVAEPQRGYGAAMLRGLDEVRRRWPETRVVVFLDADASDDPALMPALIAPILADEVDMTLGSRLLGVREPGALPPWSYWGNRLACALIRLLTGRRYTDLGPFRAIRFEALERLRMVDRDFGWTVEMQIKAALAGLGTRELPASYRRRIGVSKISGTLKGSVLAGVKILYTIARYGLPARFRFAPSAPNRPSASQATASMKESRQS